MDGDKYIYVQHMSYNLMFEDVREKEYYFEIALALGIFLLLLLLVLYIAVLQKLHPLRIV